MRKVKRGNYTYSNDEYVSVFVGNCDSEEKLFKYVAYNRQAYRDGYMCSELGDDFKIPSFDEDFKVAVWKDNSTNNLDELFEKDATFKMSSLKMHCQEQLDDNYNVIIIFGKMKYEGNIKEVQNNDFGYFKFLCTFPEDY